MKKELGRFGNNVSVPKAIEIVYLLLLRHPSEEAGLSDGSGELESVQLYTLGVAGCAFWIIIFDP